MGDSGLEMALRKHHGPVSFRRPVLPVWLPILEATSLLSHLKVSVGYITLVS